MENTTKTKKVTGLKKEAKLYKKGQYKQSVQEFVDHHEYEDGVFNDKGEMVIRPMTLEERKWNAQFNQELYLSDRKFENPILGEDYYKEISDADNARRRDILNVKSNNISFDPKSMRKVSNELVDKLDISMKTKGFEATMDNLLDETVDGIDLLINKNHIKLKLIELIQCAQRLLKVESDFNRKEKKIKKDKVKETLE